MKWYPISDNEIEAVAEELEATELEVKGLGSDRMNRNAFQSFAQRSSKARPQVLPGYHFSEHAALRQRQRGLSLADVDYILHNGISEDMASSTIFYLRSVDIPKDERQSHQRLVGTAVITAPNGNCIITIWRNRKHGLRNLRHKRSQRWYSPKNLKPA